MNNFWNGFEKQAKEPSWYERQKGVSRAMRSSSKGIGKYMVDPILSIERGKKSIISGLKGGAGGAGLGALVGLILSKGKVPSTTGATLGALAGGTIGLIGGQAKGMHDADKEYFMQKGITPKYLGFSHKFTPAAKKKYIDKYKKKK